MNVLIIDKKGGYVSNLYIDFMNFFIHKYNDINVSIKIENLLLITENYIDVLFINMNLDKYDSIMIAKKYKEKFPNLLIIFSSKDENHVFDALSIGFVQFIRINKYEKDILKVFNHIDYYLNRQFSRRVINIKGRPKLLSLDKIEYIISIGHEIIIHMDDEEYVLKSSINNILVFLNSPSLVQIQKTL